VAAENEVNWTLGRLWDRPEAVVEERLEAVAPASKRALTVCPLKLARPVLFVPVNSRPQLRFGLMLKLRLVGIPAREAPQPLF
jgi:hypothetical protein